MIYKNRLGKCIWSWKALCVKYCLCFLLLSIVLNICSYGQIGFRVTATAKQMLTSVCQTNNVKLVFLCQGSLWYVDFSQIAPQIIQLSNVVSPYLPVISSDGKWVTYQTGIDAEGPYSGTNVGKVWISELSVDGTPAQIADTGYVPRFAQNTSVDTPEIIYSTSVACPQQICYSAGQTLVKKIVNKSPQTTQTIFAAGSYYGGLSWDNRYLITGWPAGPNAFMLDLQNIQAGPHGVHSMRVKKNVTNVDTFVTIGACNISRSASRIFTNTMLYYDFSSAAITAAGCYHPLLGTWGEHERLFLSRYDSEDLQVFGMPSDRPLVSIAQANGLGEAVGKEWNNPEWSNHPYFATASLMIDRLWLKNGSYDHTYNSELLYLVDLKDSVFVRLIESTDTSSASTVDFGNPFIWVEVPAGFQEDSTWLNKTIWEKAGLGITNYNIGRNLSSNKIGNYFKENYVTITLYSLVGRKIATMRQNGPFDFAQEKLFGKLHSGVYAIQINVGGMREIISRYVIE